LRLCSRARGEHEHEREHAENMRRQSRDPHAKARTLPLLRVQPVALAITVLLAVGLTTVPAAAAPQTLKKAIWGPVTIKGKSAFPIYRNLGVGIFEMTLDWRKIASGRPANAADPGDPAYRWPPEIDQAIAAGRANGIEVALEIRNAPGWANGGLAGNWAPTSPAAFAAFARAAARRYRAVKYWLIWGEPTKAENFRVAGERTSHLGVTRSRALRYAQMLDGAYGALKAERRTNVVIGGNTFTTGDIRTMPFVRALRLRDGLPPRMDMYGHNPFTRRVPDLRQSQLGLGIVDFSDLDDLHRVVNQQLRRRGAPTLALFLSEFTLPTDHPNREFNFHLTRRLQADWLARALRIVRATPYIYTLGWNALYDDPPRPHGDEVNRGLIDVQGRRKPSYYAYRDN
jgi:hypothetical protein